MSPVMLRSMTRRSQTVSVPEMSRSQSIAFVVIAVIIACAAGYLLYSQQSESHPVAMTLGYDRHCPEIAGEKDNKTNSTLHADNRAEFEKTESVTVHVCGEVAEPGVYRLQGKNLVMHAIEAAGGATDRAEYHELNLARRLKDGERIAVPRKGVKDRPSAMQNSRENDTTFSHSADDTVDINSASEAELDRLPGIGPVMAKRILNYREEKSAFRSPEELLEVRGMKRSVYEKLQSRIRVR